MASVYTVEITRDNNIKEALALFSVVNVTVPAMATTGSAAHQMGKTPSYVGAPNPNRDEGYNARASANSTTVTVTLDALVSAETVFTVVCYGI